MPDIVELPPLMAKWSRGGYVQLRHQEGEPFRRLEAIDRRSNVLGWFSVPHALERASFIDLTNLVDYFCGWDMRDLGAYFDSVRQAQGLSV